MLVNSQVDMVMKQISDLLNSANLYSRDFAESVDLHAKGSLVGTDASIELIRRISERQYRCHRLCFEVRAIAELLDLDELKSLPGHFQQSRLKYPGRQEFLACCQPPGRAPNPLFWNH